MTIINSLEKINSEEYVKGLSYDFNIEEFCKENAIGIGIITPFEVFLIAAKLLEGIHHDMILDKVVQIISEAHFKMSIVINIFNVIREDNINVVNDKEIVGKDKHITLYGVRLESFRETLKTLEEKLKGYKQWQFTQ